MRDDANQILDAFFEGVESPRKMDQSLGPGETTENVSDESFASAFEKFQVDATTFLQAVQVRSSRDKSFSIVASLSVLFLVVVFALTYLLVQRSMDISVVLGSDAAVLVAYLGLLRYMLNHQVKRWSDERAAARDAALFKLILSQKTSTFTPEQMIALLKSVKVIAMT